MNDLVVFQKLIHYLPAEIKEDVILQELIDNLKGILKTSKICGFRVNSSIYHAIKDESLKKYLKISKGKNEFLAVIITNDTSTIFLNVREVNGVLKVTCNIKNKNNYTEFTLTKANDFNRVDCYSFIFDGEYYYDYNYDIFYYYLDYTRIDDEEIDEDIEFEKDMDFSKTFYFPIDEASKYRNNFQRYKNYINENRIKKTIDNEDKSFKDICVFSSPFIFRNLKHCVLEPDEINEKNSMVLDNIVKRLTVYFDEFDQVIVTENFINNLQLYTLDGSSEILYSMGVIAKKVDKGFLFCFFRIDDNSLIAIPEVIDQENAQKIFYGNEENKYVEGLDSFFGISREK